MDLAIPAAATGVPMQDLASFSAAYVTFYMLAAVRVLAALMFNPLLGSARVPMMGRVGLGLVRGFGLRAGAFASTVAHDAHNLVVVGVSVGGREIL